MTTPATPPPPPYGAPTPRLALFSALALFALILFAIVALAIGGGLTDQSTPLVVTLVGLVVSTVPSLIAAAFAERASKDIRNGTVVAKAKEGAVEAIRQEQVVTRDGPVVTLQMQALARLLEEPHSVTITPHAPPEPSGD